MVFATHDSDYIHTFAGRILGLYGYKGNSVWFSPHEILIISIQYRVMVTVKAS